MKSKQSKKKKQRSRVTAAFQSRVIIGMGALVLAVALDVLHLMLAALASGHVASPRWAIAFAILTIVAGIEGTLFVAAGESVLSNLKKA